MGWNYRVVRRKGERGGYSFRLQVAWYENNSKADPDDLMPWPAAPSGRSLDELRRDLKRMASALRLPAVDKED